jgi:hypothetical protein
MTPEKQSNVSQRASKESGAFKLPRSRAGRKATRFERTRSIWRALSEAALSSPHTPVLRRLHD